MCTISWHIKCTTSVQSNLAYFNSYHHFWCDTPPWPAVFGSTSSCRVGNRSVELFLPNTISYNYTILYITSFLGGVYDAIAFRHVFCLVSHRLVFSAWHLPPKGTSLSIEDDAAIHRPTQLPSVSIVAIIHLQEPCEFWCLYHGHRDHTIQSTGMMCQITPQNSDIDVIQ